MQMDEGLDTGDMLLKAEVLITPKETADTLHDKLAKAGAELAAETLRELAAGTLRPVKQGESPTPYAKMLDKKMGDIDWSRPAAQIERLVRGLNSWPGTYTCWNKKVIKIWKASVRSEESGNTVEQVKPGTVLGILKDSFLVQTGEGILCVEEVQIQGKKRMDAGAFLRGNALSAGTVLVGGD